MATGSIARVLGSLPPRYSTKQAPLVTNNRNDYLGVPGLNLICHAG
jgi:hypothetical protein